LELAAARVKTLSAEQISGRLDDRFRLLTGGSRTALPRQQTLRALIDWSYDLLAPAEKVVLRRLSVFAGGWPLEAAESVCAGDGVEDWEVLDLIARLVAKSLVVAEAPEEGRVRYRMQENLRSYAQERLAEAGEVEALSARRRDWFLALAEEAEPNLSGPEQGSWLNRLERDHDNLRAALAFSHDHADGGEAGLRLAGSLWKFWYMRGYFSEGRGFLERALARSGDIDPVLRAKALRRLGTLTEAQDHTTAVSYYEEGLSIYKSLNDDFGIALTLNSLGNIASSQGDWVNARDYYEQGLVVFRARGDEGRTAILLMNTGIVANHQKKYAEACLLYEESLAIFRRRQDLGPLSAVLLNLGDLACNRKEYILARTYLFEGLQVADKLGEKVCIASILTMLGYTAWPMGQYELAAKLFGAAKSIRTSAGFSLAPHDQSSLEENVAVVRAKLGEEDFQTAWRQGEGAEPGQIVSELL